MLGYLTTNCRRSTTARSATSSPTGRAASQVRARRLAATDDRRGQTRPRRPSKKAEQGSRRKTESPTSAGNAERLEGYRLNVPFVRRILANVPTYMIFDDHEITDDWNLTQEWRNRVLGTNLGQTILRNGLIAYAVFQALGQRPDRPGRRARQQGAPRQRREALRHRDVIDAAARGQDRPSCLATPPTRSSCRGTTRSTSGGIGWWPWTPATIGSSRSATNRLVCSRPTPSRSNCPPAPCRRISSSSSWSRPLRCSARQPATTSSNHSLPGSSTPSTRSRSTLRFDPLRWTAARPLPRPGCVPTSNRFADDDAVEALLAARHPTDRRPSSSCPATSTTASLPCSTTGSASRPPATRSTRPAIVQFTSSAARNVWPPELVHLLRFTRQFIPGQQSLLQLKAPVERLAWLDDDPTPVDGADTPIRPLRTRLRRNPVLVSPAAGPTVRPNNAHRTGRGARAGPRRAHRRPVAAGSRPGQVAPCLRRRSTRLRHSTDTPRPSPATPSRGPQCPAAHDRRRVQRRRRALPPQRRPTPRSSPAASCTRATTSGWRHRRRRRSTRCTRCRSCRRPSRARGWGADVAETKPTVGVLQRSSASSPTPPSGWSDCSATTRRPAGGVQRPRDGAAGGHRGQRARTC